jgi:hypothetical protein
VRIRTFSAGTPRISANWPFIENTPWLGVVSVKRPLASS